MSPTLLTFYEHIEMTKYTNYHFFILQVLLDRVQKEKTNGITNIGIH